MANIGTVKIRKPWLAALLSFVNTGWGQFYVGKWKRGLVLLGIETLIGLLYVFGMGNFAFFVMGGMALIAFNIFVAVDAYLSARQAGEYVLRPCNRWWVYGLLVVFNLSFGGFYDATVSRTLFNTYKIPSGSMLQTLQVGDHLMAEIVTDDTIIERGDVLILLYPVEREKHFIKRVVGLPGETVEMRDKEVFINGAKLDEPYVWHSNPRPDPKTDQFGPYVVPDGQLFVMGDNREASYDSRFVGPIVRKDIIARAKYLYFPAGGDWSRWGKSVR